MSDNDLILERYRLVTHRQEYHGDRMWTTFTFYIKTYTTLVVASVTLVSTKLTLNIPSNKINLILFTVAYLITFLGFVSVGQIALCLNAWIGYRRAESDINTDAPPISRCWWLFETLYCILIGVSVMVAWWGAKALSGNI